MAEDDCRPERMKTSEIAVSAPIAAASGCQATDTVSALDSLEKMARNSTTPSAAPSTTPSTPGEASSLRVMRCRR